MDASLIFSFFLIFVLRVVDTTLSTLTTMFMSQGNKKIAPITGCLQTATWVKDSHLVNELRNMNLMVTVIDGQGRDHSKRLVIFIALQRKKLPAVRKFLRDHKVFITVSKGDMYLNI